MMGSAQEVKSAEIIFLYVQSQEMDGLKRESVWVSQKIKNLFCVWFIDQPLTKSLSFF